MRDGVENKMTDKEDTKVIVRNQSLHHTDLEVIKRVVSIMEGGRISGNGTCYCFLSVYPDGLHISAVRNKVSDTFTAY